MSDLKIPTDTEFESCLNQSFTLQQEGSDAVKMELISLDRMGDSKLEENTRQRFSLVFRGPKEPMLEQCIYALENPKLGRTELFLVPVGPDDTGQLYEAVFT